MKILDLITIKEELEPETISMLFPEISTLDRANIMVMKLLLQSNIIFEDMDVFENAVDVLNNIHPDIDHMTGSTPLNIWKAILKIKKIRKNFEFSYEVLMYIKYIFNDNGYYFYPDNIGIDNKLLIDIKKLILSKEQLKEDFLGIQAYKYMKILEGI